MSRKYKFKNPFGIYFVSFAVINWIDLFIRNEYRDVMVESFKYCIAKKGLDLYAWVIMTSHLHLIMGSQGDKPEHIMRDIKRWTSIELKQMISSHPKESRKEWIMEQMYRAGIQNPNNKEFQLWQQDSHPIELTTPEITWQKLNYVHNNPVVAGFTDLPENYLYSSARDYVTNRKGLVEIKRLDPMTVVVR